MRRDATAILTALLLALPVGANAQDPDEPPPPPQASRDSGHRFMVDIAPYTAWGWYEGLVDPGAVTDQVDATRGSVGIALHWEYNPIPYLGLGVKVDIQLPVDKPSFLMVLPTAGVRGILPLMDARLELFVLAQVGATYLQYGDTFVGYGWMVAGSVGAGYHLGRRWGVHLHMGYMYQAAASGDQWEVNAPLNLRGFFGVFYRL